MPKEPSIWAPSALMVVTFVIAVAIVIQECPAWGSLAQDIPKLPTSRPGSEIHGCWPPW